MDQDLLQEDDLTSVSEKSTGNPLPKIVPPKKKDELPDTGYKYVLTDVTEDRYKPRFEEEISEAQNKLNKIKAKVGKDVSFYKNERRKNKVRAFVIRVMSTLMAAVITILLGLNIEGLEKTFNTMALVISGFLTVIGILQKLLDSKDLWVQYTSTVAKLEGLLFSIEYLEEGKNALRLKDVEFIKLKYDRIMESTTDFIIKVRTDTGDK
ncbi:SLATT domain-containing protein [Chondrinema litorale]|uniref:SLATT domain-containing protein n=1 Tax=Chondrinema litorale TaxID=2994555 RepID=UPI0025428B1C|nr:SLATT domain-containing protein [Chondrinema litorale]UZR93882.1 SLATT domain-containing protein [Chondrinema litorale]